MNFKYALVSVLLSTSVFAGRETGNGGFAHVCRGVDNKITSAQLLDLWESEELNTWSTNLPAIEQINTALNKISEISPDAENIISDFLTQIKSSLVFSKRPLTKTADALPPYEPGLGCAYEQVARFEPVLTETGKRGLRIHSEIYNSPFFSESDKAALMLHEAIYLADRTMNDAMTSTRTRTLVAHLFSESTIPNAVRMTFGKLTSDATRIWATMDPLVFKFSVQISEVDKVSYSEDATDEQKESLYRCTAGELFKERTQGDTGWISLEKLLDLDLSPGGIGSSPVSIKGSYAATFESTGNPGQTYSDSLRFACSKKGKDGIEKPVQFSGYYFSENSECLGVDENGAVSVYSGDSCLAWIKDTKASELEVFSSVEIVKAEPGSINQ